MMLLISTHTAAMMIGAVIGIIAMSLLVAGKDDHE